MNLPDLPKKRRHKEADITPSVFDWFEKNYPFSVVLEIKDAGGRLKDHQPIALRQVQDGKFRWKIPDMGRRNPFDGIILKKGVNAFIVVCGNNTCTARRIDGEEKFDFKI